MTDPESNQPESSSSEYHAEYSPKYSPECYMNWITGAATFDLQGLPKDYYVTDMTSDVYWVQAVFQTLGLRSLLLSTFELDELRHLLIQAHSYRLVLVHRPVEYLVVLLPATEMPLPENFIPWLLQLDVNRFKQDERFSLV